MFAQNLRTMCVMYPRVMKMLRAPAARGARNEGCYSCPVLLDPNVHMANGSLNNL
jgi:hypothetical protein